MEEALRLFRQYKDSVYRLALSFTGSVQDAEDVTQTVFLKLLETKPVLEAGRERAWLFQVAANECRSLWRRLSRRRTEPLEAALTVAAPEADRAAPEADRAVLEAVGRLKPGDRAVLYLFYYEGYSARETGELLGISQSAVTTRLQRARQKLKTILEQEGIHETGV